MGILHHSILGRSHLLLAAANQHYNSQVGAKEEFETPDGRSDCSGRRLSVGRSVSGSLP